MDIKLEQFIAGVVMGLALRSTDILPVAVGFAMGAYVANRDIDYYGTALNMINNLTPGFVRSTPQNNKE